MTRTLRSWAGALVLALTSPLAAAQGFPDKAVRFIVPYPPGGVADLMARILQPKVQAALGQPLVIETRAGAGGNVGTDYVAKSAPDGYTILFSASGPLAINKTLYRALPYDPERDLRGVIQLAAFPMVLLVEKDAPPRNPREFVEWARSRPKPALYGSAGSGTPQHLVAELFARSIGAKFEHIPYKGGGPALQDLIAGSRIPFMFEHIGSALQHARAGRVRALAVTGAERSAALPEAPTLAETVAPGFDLTAWNGVSAPKATPGPVIAVLNRAFRQALEDPQIRARWTELGSSLPQLSPESFDALVRSEIERFGQIVRETGAKAD